MRSIPRRLAKLTVLTLCVAPVLASGDRAGEGKAVSDAIRAALEKNEASLVEFRRDLHRHPELAGEEERTAAKVAERLRAAGLEVTTGVGGHGVVGVLRGGAPGPVVAYRADMDAIPTTGHDPVEFRSLDESKRHGCGHDVHTTVAVGMAEALATVRDALPGTVTFIFQPAEEDATGAAAMIEDGVLDEPAPQAIFALHCAPLEVGQFGSMSGMLLPGLDVVTIRLSGGEGDYDAAAKQCVAAITSVAMMPSGATKPSATGLPRPGDKGFIVAQPVGSQADGDGWTVQGMVRASSEDMHHQARDGITAALASADFGEVTYELDYTLYAIPPTMNDAALIETGNDAIASGAGIVVAVETTPFFSEDFSHFQKKIPGAMYFLGVANAEKGIVGMPHSPGFVVDEDAIVIGANAMANVLLNYLRKM